MRFDIFVVLTSVFAAAAALDERSTWKPRGSSQARGEASVIEAEKRTDDIHVNLVGAGQSWKRAVVDGDDNLKREALVGAGQSWKREAEAMVGAGQSWKREADAMVGAGQSWKRDDAEAVELRKVSMREADPMVGAGQSWKPREAAPMVGAGQSWRRDPEAMAKPMVGAGQSWRRDD